VRVKRLARPVALLIPLVLACDGTNSPLVISGTDQAGTRGPPDPTGAAGSIDVTGAAGTGETTGAAGVTGAAGAKTGAAGTTGVAGVTGAAGVTGTAGTAPVVCSNAGVTGHQPVTVNGGWIDRTPATRPAAWPKGRRATAMAYDFTTGRTVMYGGYANALPAVDTWEWNGTAGTWSERRSRRRACSTCSASRTTVDAAACSSSAARRIPTRVGRATSGSGTA
jgi:hypothetical protein